MKIATWIISILSVALLAGLITFIYLWNKQRNKNTVVVKKTDPKTGQKTTARVKLTSAITNTPQGCPQGSTQIQLPDGTWSCKSKYE